MNCMLDLETLSTKQNAVVVSIGACLFNMDGIRDEFYSVLEIDDQIKSGRSIDGDTLAFWMKQSEEARQVFREFKTDTTQTLLDFGTFIHGFYNLTVWGNGAAFDNSILSSLYSDFGVDLPWKFYNDRCYRTVKSGYSFQLPELQRVGTYHNALDDAKSQALHLIEIARVTGLAL